MAGRQGSSPLATGKLKGDSKPSQMQINSFFIDRSPEGRTKAQNAEQKLEVLTGLKQTAIIAVEKDRFSLAKFSEWLDRSLEQMDTQEWNMGSKTRFVVDGLLQKYSQQSALPEKPEEQPSSQDNQPRNGRKYTTRATRARRPEEKEVSRPKPEPAVVEDEQTHRNWVRKCLFKSLAKFIVLSYQYSWENKYRPSNVDEVGERLLIKVLNGAVAGQIKDWFAGYFAQKQETEKMKAAAGRNRNGDSDDDMALELLDIEEVTMARRSQDAHESFMEYDASLEDNSLPKLQKKYACLLLVGRPGVGKTSAIEAISASQGYILKTIDCTMYESFLEIKKAYKEAVKSMVVEHKHTNPLGKSVESGKQPPGLMNFFSTMKPPPQQPTSVRSPQGEVPQPIIDGAFKMGSQPNSSHKEPSTSENSLASSAVKQSKKILVATQKVLTTSSPCGHSQERKVFLLQNVDRFFSGHEQPDKIFKSMLEFFEYSQFPFVLEVNKSGRDKIGESLFEADLIEYTRPKGPRPAKALGIMADIEALKRFPSVRQIQRNKDGELSVPIAEGYNLLLKQALESFEAALECVPQEELTTSGGLSLEDLSRLVEAYDYNLVSLGTYLQYYALKPDSNMFNKVAAGLQASLGPSLKEEYKPSTNLTPEIVLEAPNRDVLQQNPITASCISTSDLKQTELMLKCFVAQLGLAAEHSDWDRLRDSGPAHDAPGFSILEAEERVFMEQVSAEIKETLSKCCGLGTCNEPEFFNLLRLLKDCPPTFKPSNGPGLRFKVEKLANPLKLFFDQTAASDSERTALCRQLFKRFHRRSEPVHEPNATDVGSLPPQTEIPQTANPKRKNVLLVSDEENEAVL